MVAAEVAAPLLDADFTHTALYDELAARTGLRLESGHEHIRSVVPSRARAPPAADPPAAGALPSTGWATRRPHRWSGGTR